MFDRYSIRPGRQTSHGIFRAWLPGANLRTHILVSGAGPWDARRFCGTLARFFSEGQDRGEYRSINMQTNPTPYINPRRPSCALLLLGQLSLAPVSIPEHSPSQLTTVHRLALRAAPRPSPLPDLTTQPPTSTIFRIAATSSSDLHPQLRGRSLSRLLRSS